MKFIIFAIFINLSYLIRCLGNKVVINVLTFSIKDIGDMRNELKIEFDKYAEKNNLNVTINVEIMNYENPTSSYEKFKLLVESSLKKSNNIHNISNEENATKFDLYFFDTRFTNLYGPYLLNLKDYIPKEFIEMYNSDIIEKTSFYNNQLVGLPTSVSYEILYSNFELLGRYNKSIPKTWDELIETCKYIMEKEKENSDLICYNGLFDDGDQGLTSLYEFIYSCRDSYNSTYPNIKDKSFIDSLKMLKKLKTEVDPDNYLFSSNENFTFMKLLDGKSIFLKYWFIGDPLIGMVQSHYYLSTLPGMKEGIFGSILSGTNIGIIKNISEDKREAAIEVLKCFTNKEYQKVQFKKKVFFTGIDELWNDEETCTNGLCDIVKSMQYTVEPEFIKEGPENYRKKYQKYINEFMYENKTIEETLKKINDIKNRYYISLNTKNSYVGFIWFIFISVVSIIMLLSLVFLFTENFRPFFMFLPDGFWIITILGSMMILWIPLIGYESVNTLKCHMKFLFICIGYTLSVCPTMYKLIIQFPEDNKLFTWIYKHKYLFLLLNILIDVIMNSFSLIKLCTLQTVLVEDGESYEKCKYNGEYSFILLIAYKFVVMAFILFLIFVEWNNSSTLYDMRFIILALYIDILSTILVFIFHVINIKNYVLFFTVQSINTTAISFSNYIFLYGFRIVLGFMRKQNIKLEFINRINENFINNETQLKSKTCNNNTNNDYSIYKTNVMDDSENNGNETSTSVNKSNFIRRMINYHFSTESCNTSSMSTSISI